jgi:hypothetical protein
VLEAGVEEERQTLDRILAAGIDQGWFLRAGEDELVIPSPAEAEHLHRLAAQREPVHPTAQDPWATGSPPVQAILGTGSGWVVLTQRCDLIRSYRLEPLVEVARATLLNGSPAAAAKSNSPRLIAFAEAENSAVWAGDLRQRAWLPKVKLPEQSDLTCAIDTERARKRFRLRLGQRYWRDPVPDDLVATLQEPLHKVLEQSASRIAKLRNFSMWLGQRVERDRVLVIAVASEERHEEAEQDWDELMQLLRKKAPNAHALIESEESGVYRSSDVSLALWLDTFKFDFDELSYGRRADDDHAVPDL